MCRLVSEFGTVCERKKLRVNVNKGKVMRCSKYVSVGQIYVRLNSKPLNKVFSTYLGLEVAGYAGREKDLGSGIQNE